MALTSSEEALVRQLLDQQAAILSLANNEATIQSKLGATKVTLADLVAASSLADADLLLTRQGTTDKSVRADILATYMGAELGALFAPIANPTFTGDPKAPTPAQFDNDTSLATTEFVQRALGNFASDRVVTSSQTLTAADAGRAIVCNSASPITITLPLAGDVASGSAIVLFNNNSGLVTVQRQGTNTVSAAPNGISVEVLQFGTLIISSNNGGDWRVVGGTSNVPTADQFNNSRRVSSTEFVQRALGNARGFVSFTTNAALTAAHAGMEIYASSTGSAITLTLPAANALPAGAKFRIYNTGVSDVIVSRAGADTIVLNNTTNTVTTVTLRSGDSIVLTSLGTGNLWYHGGGTAQLGNAGAFGSSLTTNGWQRLPSGLIVQWGSGTPTAGRLTQSLAVAFPANHLIAVATVNGGGNNVANIFSLSSTQIVIDEFIASSGAAANGPITWIAIGR